jgi:hypothetical protein
MEETAGKAETGAKLGMEATAAQEAAAVSDKEAVL